MFDVFYITEPTGLFVHERHADSIEHARELSRTRYLWIVDGRNDYSRHDWLWEPVPWEADQTHVWPSQHQENGGTHLVPKHGGEAVNRSHPKVIRKESVPIIGIDHGDGLDSIPCDMRTRFISDYLGTLRRALAKADHEYVWVVSSVCDYTGFDFTWHPSEWQQDMLHVFASNEQKFGDTFYIHVPSFLNKTKSLALLEWFDTIHFVERITVPRRPIPVVKHDNDTHVAAIWRHDFVDPVVQFCVDRPQQSTPTVNLWRQETRAVVPLSVGASAVLVPREAKNFLKTQLYDYPVIDKTQRQGTDQPQDVIFISNGEPMAEANWLNLLSICARAKRSDGVTGREAAYKAAAKLSTTPWFYAVFAKTEVLPSFKFDFQPDRLQAPKHYIFHSRNPLNGLEYGAMNINLYNKQLTLDTKPGLDFTLSAAHEVVPVCASISRFNTDPWITWRSAFREVLKLKQEVDQGAGPEIQHRLRVWCQRAQGDNAEYCLAGANDALAYYQSVDGDVGALQLSFDWAWLEQFYYDQYQTRPWLESIHK